MEVMLKTKILSIAALKILLMIGPKKVQIYTFWGSSCGEGHLSVKQSGKPVQGLPSP